MSNDEIRFRPLDFADLPLMHRWLNRDLVARWWPGWPTPEQVREKYAPSIDGSEPSRGYIIEVNATPIGFIQCYLIRDWPDYAKYVAEDENAAGMDVFIGEPEYAHRGLGPRIMRAFLRDVVFPTTGAVSCIIGPAVNNSAAIRAYEKAGFKYLKTVSIPDELEPEYLMRIGRDELDGEHIRFRALEFADLPLMHRWLNRDFVARWWPGSPTLEQVREDYAPLVDGADPTRAFVIEYGARPIGYIQCYTDVADSPAFREHLEDARHAAGIDLFIGEREFLYRGFGQRIVRAFLNDVVFALAGVTSCIIDPAPNNSAAIRAYEKAGFHHVKTIAVAGEREPAYLMRITRDELDEPTARTV